MAVLGIFADSANVTTIKIHYLLINTKSLIWLPQQSVTEWISISHGGKRECCSERYFELPEINIPGESHKCLFQHILLSGVREDHAFSMIIERLTAAYFIQLMKTGVLVTRLRLAHNCVNSWRQSWFNFCMWTNTYSLYRGPLVYATETASAASAPTFLYKQNWDTTFFLSRTTFVCLCTPQGTVYHFKGFYTVITLRNGRTF